MTDAQSALTAATAALQDVAAAVAEKDAALNQLSLQVDSLSVANVSLQAQLDTANQTIAALRDPWSLVDKTGTTDVTDKVQALWDKGLPMPAGKYLVDAVKGLTANGAVVLDPQAVLVVKPNASQRYCAVTVLGSFTGGQVIGDRDAHTYSATGTDEWGYGLRLATGAKVANVQVSKCTGDGLAVVGDNVEIRNVTSQGNRRQGMSVFACKGLRVYDSTFADTAGAQNGPCAGVDFEPDNGAIVDARLERCVARNNRAGFLAWVRAEVAGNVDVTLVDCITDNNANGMQGKGLNGKVTMTVQGGKHTNRSAGCRVESGATFSVSGCTFAFTGKTRVPFTLTGMDSRTKYDIQFPATTGLPNGTATVGTNSYV